MNIERTAYHRNRSRNIRRVAFEIEPVYVHEEVAFAGVFEAERLFALVKLDRRRSFVPVVPAVRLGRIHRKGRKRLARRINHRNRRLFFGFGSDARRERIGARRRNLHAVFGEVAVVNPADIRDTVFVGFHLHAVHSRIVFGFDLCRKRHRFERLVRDFQVCIEFILGSRCRNKACSVALVFHVQEFLVRCADGKVSECATLPRHGIDSEAATGADARNGAVLPLRRKRRENADLSVVALHEHFIHARNCTEVTVNLERRMRIEKVIIGLARSQEHTDHLVGMIAIVHTSPEVDFPGKGPTRRIVAALFQRNACALDQVRSIFVVNLGAREKTVQVRNMAVVVGRVVPVIEPFHNLSVLTRPCRRKALDCSLHLRLQIGIDAKNLRGLGRVVEHVADNLVVHRRTKAHMIAAVVIFRRIARGCHQVLIAAHRFFNEAVQIK